MRRARPPSADELQLWRQAMRDTRPLDRQALKPAKLGAPRADPSPASPVSSPPTAASPPPEPARPIVPAVPPAIPRLPAPHGIDRRTLQRLKRGLVTIDSRLDLHGMTQEEAYRRLSVFLAHQQRQGARCILVITGIGDRTTGGTLRRMTPRWLAESGNAARVIAHSPAQKRHGGEGALYVLLRRLR